MTQFAFLRSEWPPIAADAVNSGARCSANALAAIESEGARGFGLSDVLLVSGARVAPVGDDQP